MNALSLFSGIGGLDLAAEMAGIKVKAFCEIEPFPVEVLKKRFPGVHIFNDVKTLTKESFMEVMLKNGGGMESSQPVDIIFGGFPCQDLSQAGKQVGLTGARSGLWFEMLRVISEFRPRYVVAENVRGAVNLALDTVYSGLVGEGYKVYPYVIPASAVGAPHQRERLFVVGVREDVANTYCERYLHRKSELNTAETGINAQCNASTGSKSMENPGCELRQGAEFRKADGVEAGNRDADKSERPGGTLWPSPVASERNIGEKVGGQLNPDWVGQFMGYPEGWTDLDVDEPREWQGWPALLGDRLWGTHVATVSCRTNRFNAGRAMIPVEFVSKGEESSQYHYEFPRTTTGCKNWAKQLKAYGNSVVPQQAYPFFKAIAEIEKITLREVIP